jgi:uncharacterized protein
LLKKILSAVALAAEANKPRTLELPIFPLGSVLFPGGVLPLKIFEQRYMDMAKASLKSGTPFGICLIREGSEVGEPAVPEPIGTMARISEWDMQQLGVLQVRVHGDERFRILDRNIHSSGLILGTVEVVGPDSMTDCPEFAPCRDFLEKLLSKIGNAHFTGEPRLDDPSWVSYRITEVLPMSQSIKQKMLELTDARMRLEILHRVLREQKLLG